MKDAMLIEELAPRACAGDREAVGQIVEATRSRLLAVAYAQLNDREDALDAVASALVQICQKAHQVRDPARIEAWMQAIVRREARQLRRARMPLLPLSDYQHPSYHVENTSQLRLDLERALRVLPAHQEQALRLHYGQQLSAREIADRFGVAEGTVKMWLHRARRFLAHQLEGYETVPSTTTTNPKPLPADTLPYPEFRRPDMSIFETNPEGRFAGILHDNLSDDLLDALKAGLTSGGYIPVPVTWDELGDVNNRISHTYNWASRLSLLVLDETVGGMISIVALSLTKDAQKPIPVPTCLFFSGKTNRYELYAFAAAGVEHFLRKDNPYDIANFARPFRRRSYGWNYTEDARHVHAFAQEDAVKRGKDTVDALDILFSLFDSEAYQGDESGSHKITNRVLREFGTSGRVVRDAVAPLLVHGLGHDSAVEITLADSGKQVSNKAFDESNLLMDDCLDTEHLLLGLLHLSDDPAGKVLANFGITLEAAREIVRRLRDLPPPLPAL